MLEQLFERGPGKKQADSIKCSDWWQNIRATSKCIERVLPKCSRSDSKCSQVFESVSANSKSDPKQVWRHSANIVVSKEAAFDDSIARNATFCQFLMTREMLLSVSF